MLKRKKVYICDHCGAVALPERSAFMGDYFETMPEGWLVLAKQDLCPVCSLTYLMFRDTAKEILRKENE